MRRNNKGNGSWTSALALTGALAVGPGAGCSFAFVKPVKSTDGRYFNPECTAQRGLPTADMAFMGASLGTAMSILSQDNISYKEPAVVASLLVATVWAVSGMYGFTNVSECRDLKVGNPRRSNVPPQGAPRPAVFSAPAPRALPGDQPPARPSTIEAPGPPAAVPPGAAGGATGPAPATAPATPAAPATPPVRQRGDDEDPTQWRRSPF